MEDGGIQYLITYVKKLQVCRFKEAVFHPDKVKHGVGRKIPDMYLAQGAAVQLFLYDKAVNEGDADIFHDHFLHSIDRSDFHI